MKKTGDSTGSKKQGLLNRLILAEGIKLCRQIATINRFHCHQFRGKHQLVGSHSKVLDITPALDRLSPIPPGLASRSGGNTMITWAWPPEPWVFLNGRVERGGLSLYHFRKVQL